MSEHEHTEPEPDERGDEPVEIEEPADAPEDLDEEGDQSEVFRSERLSRAGLQLSISFSNLDLSTPWTSIFRLESRQVARPRERPRL
jgi:hypothetical protein